MEKLFTPQEIADFLKIKKTTVYEMIKRNEITATKIGKQLRVKESDFNTYLSTVSSETVTSESDTVNPTTVSLSDSKEILPDTPLYNTNESSVLKNDFLKNLNGLVISGQNPVIDLLCAHLESELDHKSILRSSQNSYNSLYALYFEKIHVACIGFGTINPNTSFLQRFVPGAHLVRIHLADTFYGIYTAKNNPLNIHSLEDLCHQNIRFINQEKGSSARIILDVALSKANLMPQNIMGYEKEVLSDLSCAAAVMSGKADASIGAAYALHQFPNLTFIPLQKVSLELVYDQKYENHPLFKKLTQIAQSDFFKAGIEGIYGCELPESTSNI